MARRNQGLAACLLIALGAIALATVPARAANYQIVMGSDFRFSPAELHVVQGDSVYWSNTSAIHHTSTSGPSNCTPDATWDSGDVAPGAAWGRKFDVVGTFPYFCIYHCIEGMVGTIIVAQLNPTQEVTWGVIKAVYR